MESKDLPTPETGMLLTHFLTVADVPRSRAFYRDVLGGEVVMAEDPCIDRKAEVRCYMRDPDGYLIEVGQMTGLLSGVHAGTGSAT
ncbi:hypothetical protein A5719_31060 [Mycolicibacterium peregrinum]|uniref:VOC family protein n=1 Tax=Mycolicibacterium peregrinum TaxID=43304 RepID=UPI0007E9E019|nr:VOC family protein [Mycolicibacterium peregrinum]OBF31426.1 hypothetical protein A5719_31060 [Mycolicibacterium peregrinum]